MAQHTAELNVYNKQVDAVYACALALVSTA